MSGLLTSCICCFSIVSVLLKRDLWNHFCTVTFRRSTENLTFRLTSENMTFRIACWSYCHNYTVKKFMTKDNDLYKICLMMTWRGQVLWVHDLKACALNSLDIVEKRLEGFEAWMQIRWICCIKLLLTGFWKSMFFLFIYKYIITKSLQWKYRINSAI